MQLIDTMPRLARAAAAGQPAAMGVVGGLALLRGDDPWPWPDADGAIDHRGGMSRSDGCRQRAAQILASSSAVARAWGP